VLLPGADPDAIPAPLQDIAYLDLRSGFDAERLASSVRAAISPASRVRGTRPASSPYRGLRPFGEKLAPGRIHGKAVTAVAVRPADQIAKLGAGLLQLVALAGQRREQVELGVIPGRSG
jgi:hypothetical protein